MWSSILGICGCGHIEDISDEPQQTLVAPLPDNVPFIYRGKVRRNWGGDEVEIIGDRVVHYVRLAGIEGPEVGQPHWRAARRLLWKGFINKSAEVKVLELDECKCEVGLIRVGEVDFGLRLLENGLACLNADSERLGDFIELGKYRAAEAKARESKLGIWSDDSALKPSEYRARAEANYLEFLRSVAFRKEPSEP